MRVLNVIAWVSGVPTPKAKLSYLAYYDTRAAKALHPIMEFSLNLHQWIETSPTRIDSLNEKNKNQFK